MNAIALTDDQRLSLLEIRRKQTDPRNERALAVLMADEGTSRQQIASLLRRSQKTIYNWLVAWEENGELGLSPGKPTGRRSKRKEEFIPRLETWLQNGPAHYGYAQEMWTITLLQRQFFKETGNEISEDSISRALKEAGYSYKRPRKSMPANAPSKEAKERKVLEIIDEIKEMAKGGKLKIIFGDESHFSNEPYVIRGWYRRGKPFFPQYTEEKRDGFAFWRLRIGRREILLQKCGAGK